MFSRIIIAYLPATHHIQTRWAQLKKQNLRNKLLILLFIFSLSSCQINWYGDINLGDDFYYIVDPDFNSIVIPVNPKKPYASSSFVIENIESIGFNGDYILATSKSELKLKYWKIDKTQKAKKLGYKKSIIRLSNVYEIDSIEFYQTLKSEKIKQKTKTEYRKELNYE